ncbi:unnamed protein product [Sphagnum tenellum]
MPDNVIFSCASALRWGVETEAGLAFVASIGASVLGASAVAVSLFPPEQLAQLFVSLKSATVQNFLHYTSATLAQVGVHTMATVQAQLQRYSRFCQRLRRCRPLQQRSPKPKRCCRLYLLISRMLLLSQEVKYRRSLPLNLSLSVKPWLLQPATFSGLSRSLLESWLLYMFSTNSVNWRWRQRLGGNNG